MESGIDHGQTSSPTAIDAKVSFSVTQFWVFEIFFFRCFFEGLGPSVLMRHFLSPRKLSAWSERHFSFEIVRYSCHNLVTVELV